ncbi:MAG: hypothetical protein ACK4MM_04450 [Fervidobacterium sp.]
MSGIFIGILIIAIVFSLYKLQIYLSKNYGLSLHNWRTIKAIGVVVAIAVVLLSFAFVRVPRSLESQIEKAKMDYREKINDVVGKEYDKYLNNRMYLRELGESVWRAFLSDLNREDFEKRYKEKILNIYNLKSELPQAEIDKINSDYKIAKKRFDRDMKYALIFSLIAFIIAFAKVFTFNNAVLRKPGLSLVVSTIQVILALILICTFIFILIMVVLAILSHASEKAKEHQQKDEINKRLAEIEKLLRYRRI